MTANTKTPTIRKRIQARAALVRERRRRAARTWLGLAGLTYDVGASFVEAIEELRDKAEARGEAVEEELNARATQLQHRMRRKLDNRRARIRARVDAIAQKAGARGQEVERALKQKISSSASDAAKNAATQSGHVEIEIEVDRQPPLEGFDDLDVKHVTEILASLDKQALNDLRVYEVAHKNRVTILRAIDRRLAAE